MGNHKTLSVSAFQFFNIFPHAGALQESDESQLWLELLRDDCKIVTQELPKLIAETDELMAIFVTIIERTRRRNG